MTHARELATKLAPLLNMSEATALLRRVVGCESVTGRETGVATVLADGLRALGAENVTLRDFQPGRPNVWGTRTGRAGGPHVLLVGHTDTVHAKGWRERWAGTERENPFGGAIVNGELPALRKLLNGNPALVHVRSTRDHRSTLLHYVSANGVEDFRQKTPPNIVAITQLLLEAGADANAESDAYGGRSTTLGLTATSYHPEKAGVQMPLMEVLIDHGAIIDGPDTGSAVNGCLHNGRGEAAEFFARRGARLDLEAAAETAARLKRWSSTSWRRACTRATTCSRPRSSRCGSLTATTSRRRPCTSPISLGNSRALPSSRSSRCIPWRARGCLSVLRSQKPSRSGRTARSPWPD